MSAMNYRGYLARIEFDTADHIFTGHIAGIKGVVGFHGESVTELQTAFREAVDDYLESCAKIGKSPENQWTGEALARQAGADLDRA